jgi:uncharacterized protein (DUF1778 family)
VESVRRGDRIAARLSPADKALFKRAAAIRGGSLTEFVVSSAREVAERTIREHDTIALTVQQTEAVLAMLDAPPEPTTYLQAAADRYRATVRRE